MRTNTHSHLPGKLVVLMKLLIMVPPGKDIPTPLGEQEMSREAFYLARRRSKQLLHIIPTLMLSCCMMLVNPYPAQVTFMTLSLLFSAHQLQGRVET